MFVYKSFLFLLAKSLALVSSENELLEELSHQMSGLVDHEISSLLVDRIESFHVKLVLATTTLHHSASSTTSLNATAFVFELGQSFNDISNSVVGSVFVVD